MVNNAGRNMSLLHIFTLIQPKIGITFPEVFQKNLTDLRQNKLYIRGKLKRAKTQNFNAVYIANSVI